VRCLLFQETGEIIFLCFPHDEERGRFAPLPGIGGTFATSNDESGGFMLSG